MGLPFLPQRGWGLGRANRGVSTARPSESLRRAEELRLTTPGGGGVGAGELFVEGAFVGVLQLHEDAVVGPAQAFERRRAAVGSVEGDGALEVAEVDA